METEEVDIKSDIEINQITLWTDYVTYSASVKEHRLSTYHQQHKNEIKN